MYIKEGVLCFIVPSKSNASHGIDPGDGPVGGRRSEPAVPVQEKAGLLRPKGQKRGLRLRPVHRRKLWMHGRINKKRADGVCSFFGEVFAGAKVKLCDAQ